MCKDIILTITCPFCGTEHEVATTSEAYNAWQNGGLIQNAMPFLSATEREQLISHICPKCQDGIFGTEEPEDYEPDDIDDDFGFDPYEGCYTYDC